MDHWLTLVRSERLCGFEQLFSRKSRNDHEYSTEDVLVKLFIQIYQANTDTGSKQLVDQKAYSPESSLEVLEDYDDQYSIVFFLQDFTFPAFRSSKANMDYSCRFEDLN